MDRKSPKIKGALTASLLIHGILVVVLIWASMRTEAVSLEAQGSSNPVEVALLAPPPPPSTPAPTPRATPRSTPQSTPQSTPRPTDPPATPRPTERATATPPPQTPRATEPPPPTSTPRPTQPPQRTPAATTTAPPATPEPTTSRDALRPDQSRQMREQRNIQTRTPVPRQNPARTAAASSPASSPAPANRQVRDSDGSTSMRTADLPEYYCRQLLNNIARYFVVPEEKERDASALVSMRIMADGTLRDIRVVRSSGSSEHDELALGALRTLRRVAPLPDEFNRPSQVVEITFRFNQ